MSTGLNQQTIWRNTLNLLQENLWFDYHSVLRLDPSNPFSPTILPSSLSILSLFMPPLLSSFHPDYLTILRCHVNRLGLQGIYFQCHWQRHWISPLTFYFCPSHSELRLDFINIHELILQLDYVSLHLFDGGKCHQQCAHIVQNKTSLTGFHNANMLTSILAIDQWG